MPKFYDIEKIRNSILLGESLETLKKIPDESVDMVISSPPYYGLRSYLPNGHPDKSKEMGLEPTFQEFLDKMMAVIAEIKRVLKPTGSFWLNFGDCYGGIKVGNTETIKNPKVVGNNFKKELPGFEKSMMMMPERIALKMIDEQGWILRNKIKWAKQVLLKKQNKTLGSVMPTSVKDRFNESGEELYFFVKNKKYYFDLDAVRMKNQVVGVTDMRDAGILRQNMYPESKYNKFNYRVRDSVRKAGQPQFKASEEEIKRYNEIPEDYGKKKLQNLPDKGKNLNRWISGTPNFVKQKSFESRMEDTKNKDQKSSRSYNMKKLLSEVRLGIKPNTGMIPRGWRQEEAEGYKMGSVDPHRAALRGGLKRNSAKKLKSMGVPATYIGAIGEDHNLLNNPAGKNLPTIWQIGSEPHNFQKELGVDVDHFAIFPQALVEIPIKVGCPPGGLVCDPFSGSGTVALVARSLGRNYLGIELSSKYIKLSEKRLGQDILL